MRWGPSMLLTVDIAIQLVDPISDLCDSFDDRGRAMYVYLLTLDASVPDREFSICLLGIFLKKCRR